MAITTSGTPIVREISEEGRDTPKDYQRGLTQDNLEDLRSEYMPIGTIVEELPEPSEVRDWTKAVIFSTDSNAIETITIYQMINGKWFNLGSHQE